MEKFAGAQGANEGLLGHNFSQSERLYNGNQQGGFHQRTKGIKGLQG